MRIGVLTLHYGYNYGALLQAYGLCQTLSNLGHTVQLINYVPPGQGRAWWQGWGFHSGIELFPRSFMRIRFDRFRRRCLPLTRRCETTEELHAVTRDFDAVIVGSDQVWNGNGRGNFDGTYFLDFVQCRKISYAACFGDPKQPAHTVAMAGPLLQGFDYLSVRNTMSADIVRNLSGSDAEIVLDPTLLEGYEPFAAKGTNTGKYIAAYLLPHERLNLGIEVLSYIKDRLKMPVVVIGESGKLVPGDDIALSAGPLEWLRLLRGAAFVLTNSFHGTVFAVKFRKPFITWSADSVEGFRGPARIRDFLKICGLENRLVESVCPPLLDELLEKAVDYQMISERLLPCIDRSRSFLQEALTSRF